MGIMQKLTRIVNPGDVDDNYEDEYVFDNGDADAGYDYGDAGNGYQQAPMQATGTVGFGSMKQNGNSGVSVSGSALELKVIRPERWENVNQIADHLINRRTVVLNLEATNKETARRMIDFLLGVVYTIEGDIKKVAANTWVITPNNVDMSQDQQLQQQRQMNNTGTNTFGV